MCERELETEENCNILTPNSYGHQSFFPVLQGAQPEARGPLLLGAGFLHRILSPKWSGLQTQSGSRRPLLLGAVFSTTSCHQLSRSRKLTDLVQSPTQYLPITAHRNVSVPPSLNGMFDRHQAEITVMQFTGHSLPVHQSVTIPRDFYLVPYCQPNPLTRFLPITGHRNVSLPPSLEWHVWPGRRSIYNTFPTESLPELP